MNKIAVIFILIFFTMCQAKDLEKVVDLAGTWKFIVGDDQDFSRLNYNDKDWEKIEVPNSWENEGFPGYNGTAWYRYEISGKRRLPQKDLILNLGKIDDVDEVFFNGHLIGGKGSFPPNFLTAYNSPRIYKIPQKLIRTKGKNVIAVRVYDDNGPGGIVRAKNIGIFESDKNFELTYLNLEGKWKFKSGNEDEWKDSSYIDSFWSELNVPGKWEDQGYQGYNGFGWYRKTIKINSEKPQHLILRAGQIDDFDKVYFNGALIGKTMPWQQEVLAVSQNKDWQKNREYYIPMSTVNWGGVNTIAICVYDGYLDGGIIHGPVEILTRDEFKLRKDEEHYDFEEILEMIFGY